MPAPIAAKVLVIDDDQDFRAAVRSMLEIRGYEVIEADCGTDGLRKLVECRPDLITLDVMMTCDTDGYGVNHAIRNLDQYSEFRNVPVIMVSAIDQSPDERFPMSPEAALIRPDLYMTKPLDFGRFLEAVEQAVAAARG